MVKINYTHLTLVSMQCYLIYHRCHHQWIMLPGKEIPIIHIDVLPVGSLRNGSRLVCLYRRALLWRPFHHIVRRYVRPRWTRSGQTVHLDHILKFCLLSCDSWIAGRENGLNLSKPDIGIALPERRKFDGSCIHLGRALSWLMILQCCG